MSLENFDMRTQERATNIVFLFTLIHSIFLPLNLCVTMAEIKCDSISHFWRNAYFYVYFYETITGI